MACMLAITVAGTKGEVNVSGCCYYCHVQPATLQIYAQYGGEQGFLWEFNMFLFRHLP